MARQRAEIFRAPLVRIRATARHEPPLARQSALRFAFGQRKTPGGKPGVGSGGSLDQE